jgi:hypothetical protein
MQDDSGKGRLKDSVRHPESVSLNPQRVSRLDTSEDFAPAGPA